MYRRTMGLANRMGLDTIQISTFNINTLEQASLTLDDLAAIKAEIRNVRYVSPSLGQRMQLRYGSASTDSYVEGFVDLGSKSDRSPAGWRLDRGSYISQQDDDELRQVVVIGTTVRELLFPPDIDPLHQQIVIGTEIFRIKGILKKSSGIAVDGSSSEAIEMFEEMYNAHVHVPYKTGAKLLFGTEHPQRLAVVVEKPERISQTANEIRDLLLRRGVQQLSFRHPGDKLQEAKRIRNQLWLALGFIALSALIAGGLSIIGVMLMSVNERTREIGVHWLSVQASAIFFRSSS